MTQAAIDLEAARRRDDSVLLIYATAAADHIARLQEEINRPQVGAASVSYVTAALNGVLMCVLPLRDELELRGGEA